MVFINFCELIFDEFQLRVENEQNIEVFASACWLYITKTITLAANKYVHKVVITPTQKTTHTLSSWEIDRGAKKKLQEVIIAGVSNEQSSGNDDAK